MSDIQSKLAAGIREAKKQQDEPQADKPRSGGDEKGKGGAAKAKAGPASRKPAARPANDKADSQAPVATGDDPWADLHPERVWPD
jgi:hypothetical protein